MSPPGAGPVLRTIGVVILLKLPAPTLAAQSPDTSTYSSPAARELITRAAARHRVQDSSVADYRARLRYRLTVSFGRRRWGNAPPFAAEEQEATIAWKLPNDLRVDIVGRRFKSREEGAQLTSGFDQPWFVPRGLSDSVRVFGTDFPERAALHPLAADGPDWYRYVLGDTVTLSLPDGRRIRLVKVEITPRRPGPALIAGQMWLELEHAEVVRLAFRYMGTELWSTPEHATRKDSADARRDNRLINRILTLDADLEYALEEGKYWMPYRQVLSGQVQLPLVGDIYVPFEAVTTFGDYEINTGGPIVFRLPPPDSLHRSTREDREARRDSLSAERRGRRERDSTVAREVAGLMPGGGRYEIRRAPRDSLDRYGGWGDSLKLQVTEEDQRRYEAMKREIADLAEGLPRDVTGRRMTGFAYEHLADLFRFNRVQGTSVGLGYQLDIRALRYASLYGTARFGLSDRRPTGRVALVRDAPSGRWTLAAWRDLAEADPFSHGLSAANSIRALAAARDEGDYFLAGGAGVTWETGAGRGTELTLGARLERQDSVRTAATAWLNDVFGGDGVLPPNPSIEAGTFGGLLARLEGGAGRARWALALDGLGRTDADRGTARLYGEWRQPVGGHTGVTLRARGGLASRPTLPQLAFRAGGQGSVRGFDYGTQRGEAFWSVQSDWTSSRDGIRPVIFLDAGQAGRRERLGAERVLVGGGAGISFLRGLVRLDLSHPISPRPAGSGLRLDLVFGAPR